MAGAPTELATWAAASAADVIEAVMSGTSIIVKRNGTTVATVTDSVHGSQTFHGIGTAHNYAGGGERFDDFEVTT